MWNVIFPDEIFVERNIVNRNFVECINIPRKFVECIILQKTFVNQKIVFIENHVERIIFYKKSLRKTNFSLINLGNSMVLGNCKTYYI